MSFLVNPPTSESLHCPVCCNTYDTGKNAPCVNDACGHTLCGRCFLLKAGENCGIDKCVAKIGEATQATLPGYHNKKLIEPLYMSPLLAASFSVSADASLPSYCFITQVDEDPATGQSEPQFSIPDPDDEAGISQRKFVGEIPTALARTALRERNRGDFLASDTKESLKERQVVQEEESCRVFRFNYVNRERQLDEVLINISCAKAPSYNPSDEFDFRNNYGYDLVIEVEKGRESLFTKKYKVDGALRDVPLNAMPAPILSVRGFPEYLQENGTFWTVHFPRLYQEIFKA